MLQQEMLSTYQLSIGRYVPKSEPVRQFTDIGLGLTLWDGEYEDMRAQWLRWCDENGHLIVTGSEHTEQEFQRAEQESRRADTLAAQLRALGVAPNL